MVIERKVGQTALKAFDPVMTFSGSRAGLGFDWSLAMQIAGWVISGIGLGVSAYEAVKGAKDQSGVVTLEKSEVAAIASQISKADPQHRSAATWEALLSQQFGGGAVVPGVKCPEGFYPTPDGACLPIPAQAGLGAIPTWGWIVIGGLAFIVMKSGKIF